MTDQSGLSREYKREVVAMGFWTNTQTGTKEDNHGVNGTKVKCSECKTSQWIVPGTPWKCLACNKEHH